MLHAAVEGLLPCRRANTRHLSGSGVALERALGRVGRSEGGRKLLALIAWAELTIRRFSAHGMIVFAAALAYRGILALVPLSLFTLALIGLLGVQSSLPRVTALLLRLRPGGDAAVGVPLEALLSIGAIVGLWSISMGARLLIRALNVAHGVDERRPRGALLAFSLVFLPALAGVTVVAMVLLLLTSSVIASIGGWIGVGPLLSFLGSWLRLPTALALLGLALAVVYRFGPAVRPPYRSVLYGAAIALVLWVASSAAFGFAVSTVLDYGSTYGSLGAAVALLVYLHLSAIVLLFGAEVSATVGSGQVWRT